ncbi:MAG: nucleotidyltransferase domain-containing protein [Deltaproteobacteria bacterium]|nr:nucleotidyltransferase domain-containing protein [Deltaproteobacteria bacterium]
MKQGLNKRLRAIGNKIRKEYRAERVILFGSYARGDATRDSDVDLLVVAPTKERFFERIASVRRLIRELRDGLPVSPIVLTPAELAKRKRVGDPFVLEILETGVSL